MTPYPRDVLLPFFFAVQMLVGVSARADDFQTALRAYKARQFTAAFAQLQAIAQADHPQAQALLGRMYERGEGAAPDATAAVAWYEKAARQGLPAAQHDLGIIYFEGKLLPSDPEQARIWWTQAAQKGVASSQYNLGLMLLRGNGAVQDRKTALDWLEKAATQGHAEAQLLLGTIYAEGIGVEIDRDTAAAWLRRAADNGNQRAQDKLAALAATQASSVDTTPQTGTAAAPTATAPSLPPAETGFNFESWILQQTPEHYTVQLATGLEKSKLIEFIEELNLGKDVAYYETSIDGTACYVAIFGVFDAYVAAQEAAAALPPQILKLNPMIRRFAGLQKGILNRSNS